MAGYVRNRMFFSISTLAMLGVGAYVSYRLVFALNLPLWLSAALTLFILLISQTISVMRLIIVAAPGYTEEILGLIRQNYGPEVETAVLRTSRLETCQN